MATGTALFDGVAISGTEAMVCCFLWAADAKSGRCAWGGAGGMGARADAAVWLPRLRRAAARLSWPTVPSPSRAARSRTARRQCASRVVSVSMMPVAAALVGCRSEPCWAPSVAHAATSSHVCRMHRCRSGVRHRAVEYSIRLSGVCGPLHFPTLHFPTLHFACCTLDWRCANVASARVLASAVVGYPVCSIQRVCGVR